MPGCFRRAVRQSDKHHQTGKPTDVMRWLVRCCPPGGIVLDPFMGSGTTLKAALMEGRRAVGFELTEGYCEIARARLDKATVGGPLFRRPGQKDLFAGAESPADEGSAESCP